ncbi:MAG TPA: PAS domain-containing protein [Sphingomicrobium sp.]|nr:PAS domain-containing protein [Sphingomicrobium sp.]
MPLLSSAVSAGRWDLDLATGTLNLCRQSRKMFGLDPDSRESLTESAWVERLHPDDLPVVRHAMTECLVHQRPYAERFRTIHPDGSIHVVFGVGRPLDDVGERRRFVGWNFDPVSTADLAREWISARPEVLGGEHLFSIVSSALPREISSDGTPPEELLERAQYILQVRRSRERLLGRAMNGEPAFDLLLYLYVHSGQWETSLASLAKPAGIPYSSAMRWIAYLVGKGLVARSASESDRRASSVHLTSAGRAVMDALLAIR